MSKKESNKLYTTVTLSDFKDEQYIRKLLEHDIGLELALLTKLSDRLDDISQYEKDLQALKKEITDFNRFFKKFKIQKDKIRIHQSGGYTYNWHGKNNTSGYDLLKDFFAYCYDLGLRNFTIHSPYGNLDINENVELNEYKEKLASLVPDDANLEVEEICISNNELKNAQNMRFYSGRLFEKLMKDQKANQRVVLMSL